MNGQQPINIPLNINVGISENGELVQLSIGVLNIVTIVNLPISALDGFIAQLQAAKEKSRTMIVNPMGKGVRKIES